MSNVRGQRRRCIASEIEKAARAGTLPSEEQLQPLNSAIRLTIQTITKLADQLAASATALAKSTSAFVGWQ